MFFVCLQCVFRDYKSKSMRMSFRLVLIQISGSIDGLSRSVNHNKNRTEMMLPRLCFFCVFRPGVKYGFDENSCSTTSEAAKCL